MAFISEAWEKFIPYGSESTKVIIHLKLSCCYYIHNFYHA